MAGQSLKAGYSERSEEAAKNLTLVFVEVLP